MEQAVVTRADVELAYRVFLNRDPESEAVIARFMQLSSLDALFTAFLSSDEFMKLFAQRNKPFIWPPMEVEVEADSQILQRMHDQVERTWRALGEDDPYWSVLTQPEFHIDAFEANAEAFRDSGRFEVERLRAFADRAGVALSGYAACLELGCGVGRITRWLAQAFPSVVAADISRSHLRILEDELDDARISTVALTSIDAIDALPAFDVFFSIIALQHNPPPVIAAILKRILARLRSEGLGYFQLPTYEHGYRFSARDYLEHVSPEDGMEMHVLPQREIFAILEACDCKVLEVQEDGYTGAAQGISNTFFVQKR